MLKRLQLFSLIKLGFQKSLFLLEDFLLGKISESKIGYLFLKFLSLFIKFFPVILFLLLFLPEISEPNLIYFTQGLILLILLWIFNSRSKLLNKNVCHTLVNTFEDDKTFKEIPVDDKYLSKIIFSKKSHQNILIKVYFKKRSDALKNANLFLLPNKKNKVNFLGLNYIQKSICLNITSSSEKLETLESFNRLQEEEIKDHLRPIFSNNIGWIFPFVLVQDDGEIIIVSYGRPKFFSRRNWDFFANKNKDIQAINSFFKTSLMDAKKARSKLSDVRKRMEFIYSNAYFFQGLGIGNPWSWGHGWGRWSYILGPNISSFIQGKKILDLGSNFGILPLYMLRSGAKKVKGYELGEIESSICPIYKEILEWRDDKSYEFEINNKNMTEVMSEENENYDLVTAFCSIYYLDENEIDELLKWTFDKIGMIVIESNEESAVENRQDLAQIDFLEDKAKKIGFKIIHKSDRTEKYPRPLFIASK